MDGRQTARRLHGLGQSRPKPARRLGGPPGISNNPTLRLRAFVQLCAKTGPVTKTRAAADAETAWVVFPSARGQVRPSEPNPLAGRLLDGIVGERAVGGAS